MVRTLQIALVTALLTGLIACSVGDAHGPGTAAAGSITITGKMGTPRSAHTATLLPNGKVLMANNARYKHHDTLVVLPSGKVVVAGGAQWVDVYDPRTGTFSTAVGGMDDARYFATATLLQNGKVLITGGYKRGIVSTAGAWIYQS